MNSSLCYLGRRRPPWGFVMRILSDISTNNTRWNIRRYFLKHTSSYFNLLSSKEPSRGVIQTCSCFNKRTVTVDVYSRGEDRHVCSIRKWPEYVMFCFLWLWLLFLNLRLIYQCTLKHWYGAVTGLILFITCALLTTKCCHLMAFISSPVTLF